MKKLLLVLLAIVFLAGCGGHLNSLPQIERAPVYEAVEVEASYPFVVPNDPTIVGIIDEIIAAGIAEGWTMLGLAADFEDDVMIWWENPDGECECYFMVFTQSRFLPVASCETGLEFWQECVDKGECEVSRERRPNKIKGVWL